MNADKSSKYDRQLRLWGPEGQEKLENTHVLLVNASATGCEALKNLVLPGVGKFTILDNQNVTIAECTRNFFVSHSDLGSPRASSATKTLLEMNSDVCGAFQVMDLSSALAQDAFFNQFQFVIGSQLCDNEIQILGKNCYERRIPLIIANTIGLLGYCRLQVAHHTILDVKPDPPQYDLQLDCPFPSLLEFSKQVDLDTLSSIEHAHVPYIVILLQAMERWKETHENRIPKTFTEKTEWKNLIKSMSRKPYGEELNFTEAVDNAHRAYNSSEIADDVEKVLQLAEAKALSSSDSFNQTADTIFWILAKAVQDFRNYSNGRLPLPGIIPDMTAATESYITLQKIYQSKAQTDADQVAKFARKHAEVGHLAPSFLSFERIADFCKKANSIALLQTKSIVQEYESTDLRDIDWEDEDPIQSPLIWYFCIRAVLSFKSEFHRFPEDNLEDQNWLLNQTNRLSSISDMKTHFASSDHIREISRFASSEPHYIAALIGGLASQEAIKVITGQFMPIDHTYLFNGINGTAATYKL
uniref:NEDD8-activating enzyme E1 regulatory subunit n=1 Tax=Albugo laibachii Nc14 TaxID=890382 RepID=F0WHH2_9STRA|nr:SUMOactivating enzyme (SAE) putative [Albugo laibachii Nc14]|eukprot:CCA20691.1 SUMOactivating enzyme (SAE) putative [Albugo laibachii Nc14]